ncbi:hypothetical protein HT136_20945 [Novosphingobium profundi]|uniref:hypothetical protein n=1 Tax=Novosphingobium profundi TaxID=1774954 RepID=UPI001BD94470|nr:hypothetical protein [Novosphingobium profundi]MBT0670839.1 hypothetical protein [Novosphingobium profundi]
MTAYLPNESQSGLKLNFVLETSESFDSKAATTFASDAKMVTQLLGGANAMAFVSTPAVAKLEQIAGRLDATITTVFAKSSRDELSVGFAFQPPANAFADAWQLSLKGINADTSAPTLAKNWEPNVTFFMGYKRSLLTDGNEWPEYGEIINRAMFPADITSVNSMAKTITQNLAGGFSHESLNSATTRDSMAQQCQAVRRWLGQFLVGDDALAARFAVVRAYSRYNTMSDIRSVECFSASDINRLKSLSAEYVFADPIVDAVPYKVRVSNINAALGQVVSGTMIDSSYDTLKALLIELDSFRFTDASHKSLFGADAMLALGRDFSTFVCVQEKSGGKLLSVGALAVMSAGGKTPVLLSFDQAGKLEHVELTSPETVQAMLKVSPAEWPGPQAACKLP